MRDTGTSVATEVVGPTGHVGLEPLVATTLNGETAVHPGCPLKRARSIAESFDDSTIPTEGAMEVVDHEPGTFTLPIPEEGPLAIGEQQALGTCGWAIPGSIEDYRAGAGSLPADLKLADVLSRLRETGLRGRGDASADADADGSVVRVSNPDTTDETDTDAPRTTDQ
ncbi:hypothetical protein EGH23_17850 [Halomicroarcula sp. F27]|uniref:Uncharacterized protein n=1 Tax=Haloarcula nitratireducens TaxID=2487749 RepID=A0AAW4PFZ0_9EURY|nr:hypothetical protein [Halomicroarcula nitratireducens]